MTIVWFIYYTVQMIKGKDEESDAIVLLPCLLIDAILTTIAGLIFT